MAIYVSPPLAMTTDAVSVTLTGPSQALVGTSFTLSATVADDQGNPMQGVPVNFARSSGSGYAPVGTATTDAAGRATFSSSEAAATTVTFRADTVVNGTTYL